MAKLVSILVPTYNEEENVVPLSEALTEQMSQLAQYDYEIIFIDNDSRDTTREKLRLLCAKDKHIKAIFNARNYGQFNSPFYGIQQANGDCVITMCADFQDPVEMIPKYLEAWEEGNKIVLGQKTSSKESGLVYAARGFYYRFMKRYSSVDFIPQVTGSGLYDRSFVDVMRQVDDPKPFLRGVVAELGFSIKTIPFEQPKRRAGKSSNSFLRYYDAAVQSITAYTKVGVRLAVLFGTLFTIGSLIADVGLVIYKLCNIDTFSLSPYIIPMAILTGVSLNMAFIGIVGEYVLDINAHVRKRPLVTEAERINF